MAGDPDTSARALYDRRTAQPAPPLTGSRGPAPASLADILERVLDKGIVIAGDIQINLLDIELLTIKIRLLIASVERAQEMGINWWENDPKLTSRAKELEEENDELRSRLERLEEVAGLPAPRAGEEVEVQTRRREVIEEDGEKVAERDVRHKEVEKEEVDKGGRRGRK
ncbi:MAG: gas vesicle protein [Actinobacteria bacterium]|nr:gas vesicle protein [Actinomycetota bacterium]